MTEYQKIVQFILNEFTQHDFLKYKKGGRKKINDCIVYFSIRKHTFLNSFFLEFGFHYLFDSNSKIDDCHLEFEMARFSDQPYFDIEGFDEQAFSKLLVNILNTVVREVSLYSYLLNHFPFQNNDYHIFISPEIELYENLKEFVNKNNSL